jgi:hypothetical protein
MGLVWGGMFRRGTYFGTLHPGTKTRGRTPRTPAVGWMSARRHSTTPSSPKDESVTSAPTPSSRASLLSTVAAAETQQQRRSRNLLWAGAVAALVLFINWNTSHLDVSTSGITNSRTQQAISARGFSVLPQGGSVRTATAEQGNNQCISTYKTDAATAQCQAFCSTKFKKFHCMWCKCRACAFCPKGGEAIEEASKDAPPPETPPPEAPQSPPPPPQSKAASFTFEELQLLEPERHTSPAAANTTAGLTSEAMVTADNSTKAPESAPIATLVPSERRANSTIMQRATRSEGNQTSEPNANVAIGGATLPSNATMNSTAKLRLRTRPLSNTTAPKMGEQLRDARVQAYGTRGLVTETMNSTPVILPTGAANAAAALSNSSTPIPTPDLMDESYESRLAQYVDGQAGDQDDHEESEKERVENVALVI